MDKFKNAMVNKTTSYPDINWSDFNFPPILNLFHFNLAELQEPYKSIVRLIYITYLLIFVISILNIINNIVQVTQGYPSIIIFYSFLNLFIFNGAQMYVFFRGYKGLCSESGLLRLYMIFQLLLCILWLVISIINAGAFNGFTKIAQFLGNNNFLVFMCILESILYVADFILGVFCVFRVYSFKQRGDNL